MNKNRRTGDPKHRRSIHGLHHKLQKCRCCVSFFPNITAPTSGTFKGIAIYQDRRATDKSPGNNINGNSGSIIQGALYFPTQQLDYNGTGTADAICTMFVARRVNFSGNNTTTNKFKKLADCGAYGIPSGSTTRMVRLVA